ncbi:MMPL family transporter [Myxococcota bacterium]|nr:MMPL family transporter [Myxococcota bacterium]
MLESLFARLLERPARVVIVALLTCLPMGWWSVQLFSDLRADVKELLPESARSVVTLHELERRFGGFSQLSIVVESPDREANRRFSDALVAEVKKSEMVRSARNKLGEERAFFEARRFFYLDLEDLETILERIEDAANDARARANPLIVQLEDQGPVELDFSDIEKKYSGKNTLLTRFPNDYFENAEGTQLAILVRKHGLAFGIESNRQLITLVEDTIARLDPARFHAAMKVGIGGDVKNLVEEQESLVEDLALASAIVAALLGLVVIVYYRRFRALYLIAVPVTVGCLWTFGISHFAVGYLNASTAFLGPIIPGNGMNFGLILLARYIEERRRGVPVERATDVSVRYTLKATALVAVVTSIAYGSLMVTDFLGFKHFGLIGGLGMVLCWVATFLVMPPLIVWSERARPMDPANELKLFRPGFLASLPAKAVQKVPHVFAWGGLVAGLVSLVVSVAFLRDPFEKDFSKLRSTVSLTSGSAQVVKKVDDIFGIYQEPQIIMAEHEEDVPAIVAALHDVIAKGGELAPIVEATALTTLVAKDQEAKLEVLRKIRAVLSDDLLSNLGEEQRKLAEKHRPPADLATFGPRDLPESVRMDFRERDGTEGRVVLALPNMKLNLYDADEIEKVAAVLRAIELPNGKVVESSGNFVVYSDMISAVRDDGPLATFFSLLGVIVVCVLAYRRVSSTAVVLGSFFLGLFTLGAAMELWDLKINFLNFIALPITFGIGADYAINLYTRYLLEKETKSAMQAAYDAVASTGGAVVLCSLTTVIGYGSLLLARNGALLSFGKVAIIGELTCLVAAMLVLPAWLMLWGDRRKAAPAATKSPEAEAA